ncbi:hypothetical protein BV25DRAFT_1854246 [Artomyces pyxidatus]|uniref:Uncharacterized protein n=1 Tax=Artomyces pyxidatus TaxID=48021 RepID=A0ACB8T5L9_9AGAM|nr:hypothetical protein BV25DRAFT_1854246 [Artomyces pyxidatus]
MDAGAFKILESATLKTLHAHSFARSSAQASLVMTDMLSRYLVLLSTTCAQYAQHSGRTDLTARDALCALDELGVSMEELQEYADHEGEDLARYVGNSSKRIEDLNDFKVSLKHGLPSQRESIPLVYAPLPDASLDDEDEYDGEESSQEDDIEMEEAGELDDAEETTTEPVASGNDASPSRERAEQRQPTPHRPPSTPPLPLSPISNPSSPARKRPRTENWKPPAHVPSFLPPFPAERASEPPEPEPLSLPPLAEPSSSTQPLPFNLERAASPPRLSSSVPADYTSVVPYSLSTLASTPEWHLPSSTLINASQHITPTPSHLPVPQVQPALLAAYHHILTHPPPANPNAANPSRHRVAMALLRQAQRNPRWEPADTLYGSTPPNAPAVAAIGPSHAVMIGTTPSDDRKDKEEEKKLPSAPPRPVATLERITPLVSLQSSRIPELAREILPGAVYSRTTRLAHPPVLSRGPEKLLYGPGVAASWNSALGPTPPSAVPTPTTGKGKESTANGLPNGKGKEPVEEAKALPDARFYATWEYEQKNFREPLVTPRRARQGSIIQSSVGPGRLRSESTQSRTG